MMLTNCISNKTPCRVCLLCLVLDCAGVKSKLEERFGLYCNYVIDWALAPPAYCSRTNAARRNIATQNQINNYSHLETFHAVNSLRRITRT